MTCSSIYGIGIIMRFLRFVYIGHEFITEVEDCNKDPCVRLFFAGCFLLLPLEKEKPDTQATTDLKVRTTLYSIINSTK